MIATSVMPDFRHAEQEYCAKTSSEHRKKYAQFFTPLSIATCMTDWLISSKQGTTMLLDPAFGLGHLLASMDADRLANIEIVGYELDTHAFSEASRLWDRCSSITLRNEDFLVHPPESLFDAILCNPPYLKFHDYDNVSAIAKINATFGTTLNGFTNIHSLFILQALSCLKKGGRAAFIVPSEFLNSDYGVHVKDALLKTGMLRYVMIIDFSANVFKDALTTSCILLFANDEHKSRVEFLTAQSEETLFTLQESVQMYPKMNGTSQAVSDIIPAAKWRRYYQERASEQYRNLIPLRQYGKVSRGIATGDNAFFTFNRAKQQKWHIPDKYLLPCLTKAAQCGDIAYTNANHSRNLKANESVMLLNAEIGENEAVKRYLKHGEEQGTHTRFLTKNRTPWYALERRAPAPILVTVFNRNGLRFVWNEANVYNLTAYHCFYPNLFAQGNEKLLFAYLITDVAKEIFRDNRREYGDGLEKFEPNDLNSSLVLDLSVIDSDVQKTIEEHISHMLFQHSAGQKAVETLQALNEIFVSLLVQ
ncbi:MAG: SAM-dependent DNA methyltransferase [Candidatus Kapaibacterium sp.]|nr:MAG: SAM-dependent DNA methyltransferase [Candidatus Kapabacteria bacterium]